MDSFNIKNKHFPINIKVDDNLPSNTWGMVGYHSATVVVNGVMVTYIWDKIRFNNGKFEFVGLRQVPISSSDKSPSET